MGASVAGPGVRGPLGSQVPTGAERLRAKDLRAVGSQLGSPSIVYLAPFPNLLTFFSARKV